MSAFTYIPGVSVLTISKATQRRFILGKQGLYPGRRWKGKEGVVQAIRAGSVVQVDPLNVVSRNHDIVLYGRVREYQPAHLDAALYTDRALFDYGGTVMIHPMEELPFWRESFFKSDHLTQDTHMPERIGIAIGRLRTAEIIKQRILRYLPSRRLC